MDMINNFVADTVLTLTFIFFGATFLIWGVGVLLILINILLKFVYTYKKRNSDSYTVSGSLDNEN